MNRVCIVSVGTPGGDGFRNYTAGRDRLEQACKQHLIPRVIFHQMPVGAPLHAENPFAFKLYAMKHAMEQYDRLLWVDCSMWPLEFSSADDLMEGKPVALFHEGFMSDRWCHDQCLAYFGVTREQAKSIPHGCGKLVGIDLSTPLGSSVWEMWWKSMEDGMFKGYPHNHRWDQSCLGLVAHRLGAHLQAASSISNLFGLDGSVNP